MNINLATAGNEGELVVANQSFADEVSAVGNAGRAKVMKLNAGEHPEIAARLG